MGVDGSPTSLSALEWAAREACLRGATLEVVHATFLRQDAMDLDAVAGLKSASLRSSMRRLRRPLPWRPTSSLSDASLIHPRPNPWST